VAASAPDLLVLDVTMPVMDGFQVVEELRSRPETAGLPVILLTALSSNEEIWAGWNKGVDYYMTKPFDIQELIRFIDYIFNEPNKNEPPVV
ncbi:MAG: response regulator, partial [Actinomycetota bacterium]